MSCRCRCVPLPAWQGTCAVDFFVITWLLLLLHVTTHYCYLDVLEQDHCVHKQQHGMEVQEAIIGGQRRGRRYLPNTSEESWQFLLGVAQLAEPAKQHLVGAYHLWPPQLTQTDCQQCQAAC